MFRILCDPSSGSTELCLTEITRSDSQIFCRVLGRCLAANLWCVCTLLPYCTHKPQIQNYVAKHRPSTRQNICESLPVISVKPSSVLPDDGSHKIRNMSELFLILCLLNFYTTQILTSKFCTIECISRIIKVIE